MHTRTHLMCRIDENVRMGTFFEDIRTCDCFLWRTISFMNELRKIKEDTRLTFWYCDQFEDLMGFYSFDLAQENKIILLKEKPVVCCYKALYHKDYLSYVSRNKLRDDCLAEVGLPGDALANCAFYLEDELMFFDRLCFNCKFNLLSSVSDSFDKINRYGLQ